MELNTDMIDLCFNNSVKPRKQEIHGELYTSKDKKKKKKLKYYKDELLTLAGVLVVGGLVLGAAGIAGKGDFVTEIREEINTKNTYMNPFGEYITEYAYGDNFRDAMIELDDSALNELYSNTSKEMREEGLKDESRVMEDVVERMSIDYKEDVKGRK